MLESVADQRWLSHPPPPNLLIIWSIFYLPILNPFRNILLPLAFAQSVSWSEHNCEFNMEHLRKLLPCECFVVVAFSLETSYQHQWGRAPVSQIVVGKLKLSYRQCGELYFWPSKNDCLSGLFHLGTLGRTKRKVKMQKMHVESGEDPFVESWCNTGIQKLLENWTCGLFWKTPRVWWRGKDCREMFRENRKTTLYLSSWCHGRLFVKNVAVLFTIVGHNYLKTKPCNTSLYPD